MGYWILMSMLGICALGTLVALSLVRAGAEYDREAGDL
jgi:hypothetical protein